ncbi:MAG: hypothetical protein FWD48_07790 [Oscillospiraceae bacterium]|nr:hypothetical protein [Oscillospiraceae bacterium]
MKIILFLIVVLLFSACAGEPAPLDAPEEPPEITEEQVEIPTEPEIITTTAPPVTTTAPPVVEEEPKPVNYINILEDDIIEINITKMLNHGNNNTTNSVIIIEDRYLFIGSIRLSGVGNNRTWVGSDIDVYDMSEQRVIISEQLDGHLTGGFQQCPDNGIYIYSYTRDSSSYREYYYKTYITVNEIQTEFIGEDRFENVMNNRVLRHIDGGIFEEVGGELIELLPPTPEEAREYDEEGRWYLSYNNIGAWRFYNFVRQIDENRFIYRIRGYEWSWGIGMYDFSTGKQTDFPDTADFWVMDIENNLIYSEHSNFYVGPAGYIYTTNIDTLETKLVFDRSDFPAGIEDIRISPDKQRVAFHFRDGRLDLFSATVHVVNLFTNEIEKTFYFDSLSKMQFMDNNSLLLQRFRYANRDDMVFIVPLNLD